MARFCTVDVETTGLRPGVDRIVWIAANLIENGSVIQTGHVAIRDVAHLGYFGPPPERVPRMDHSDALKWLKAWVDWAGCVVAHNASFDTRMLKSEFGAVGMVWPEVPVICTKMLAEKTQLRTASLSLTDCCAAVGVTFVNDHSADHDVAATSALLLALLPEAGKCGLRTPAELATVTYGPAPGSSRQRSGSRSMSLAFTPLGGSAGSGAELSLDEVLARLQARSAQREVEKVAAYTQLSPDHRAAHEAIDALPPFGSGTKEQWSAALHNLTATLCPEAPAKWQSYVRSYGKGWKSTKALTYEALDALRANRSQLCFRQSQQQVAQLVGQ